MNSLSSTRKVLFAALVAYVVAGFFLTPLGGLETRPVSDVTPTGFVALGLLIVGLLLAIVSLVMLLRGSERASITATIAAILYFPAFLADVTGLFSKFRPPAAISLVEWIQVVVAAIAIILALRARMERPATR